MTELPPGLLAAILDAPAGECGPRLVAADWLDEHDEPDTAALVRLQCRPRRWFGGGRPGAAAAGRVLGPLAGRCDARWDRGFVTRIRVRGPLTPELLAAASRQPLLESLSASNVEGARPGDVVCLARLPRLQEVRVEDEGGRFWPDARAFYAERLAWLDGLPEAERAASAVRLLGVPPGASEAAAEGTWRDWFPDFSSHRLELAARLPGLERLRLVDVDAEARPSPAGAFRALRELSVRGDFLRARAALDAALALESVELAELPLGQYRPAFDWLATRPRLRALTLGIGMFRSLGPQVMPELREVTVTNAWWTDNAAVANWATTQPSLERVAVAERRLRVDRSGPVPRVVEWSAWQSGRAIPGPDHP